MGAVDAVLFDTRSHIFYRFPKLTGQSKLVRWCYSSADGKDLFPQNKVTEGYQDIVLTTTHIIVIHVIKKSPVKKLLVQAYVLPDGKELQELCPSHQVITEISFEQLFLLRDSVIDPITGSTHLRLLCTYPRLECTDIMLPANSTENILSMSIKTHLVIDIPNFHHYPDGEVVAASEGLARGVCIIEAGGEGRLICKFSIDETSEQCVGEVGTPHLPWHGAILWEWWSVLSDCVGGRLLCSTFSGTAPSKLVVSIVDFE